MTREEAIKFGETVLMFAKSESDKHTYEFTSMAVEALKQKPHEVYPSIESTDRIIKELIWLKRKFRNELHEEFKENIEGITDEFVQDLIISDAIYKKMSEEMPDKWFECCCFRG